MILLSLALEQFDALKNEVRSLAIKVDSNDEKVDRLDKKIDKLGETMATIMKYVMAGAYLPDETSGRAGTPDQVGSDGKKSKPTRGFAEYIRVPEKAEEILTQLHEWIDGRQRVKALVYIQAAIEARVLNKPPYSAASIEFPVCLGCKSLYYAYVDDMTMFTDPVDHETKEKAKTVLKEITMRGRQ